MLIILSLAPSNLNHIKKKKKKNIVRNQGFFFFFFFFFPPVNCWKDLAALLYLGSIGNTGLNSSEQL